MKNKIIFAISLFFLVVNLNAQYHLYENFDSLTLPQGWTTNAISGSQTWSFGLDGAASEAGNNNLNGTGLAYFDDDVLGSASTNNTASLTSPVFDNSSDSVSVLSFTYLFRALNSIPDSFLVEVFDGSIWQKVYSRNTSSSCQLYAACQGLFLNPTIDITSYKNQNCQIRFTYHDGNDWGYYVGIDDVFVSNTAFPDMAISNMQAVAASCPKNIDFRVDISNNGLLPSTDFVLAYRIDSSPIFYDTLRTTLNPGAKVNYRIITSYLIAQTKNYTIDAWIIWPGDIDHNNDSLFNQSFAYTVAGQYPPVPYYEDFETFVPLGTPGNPDTLKNGWTRSPTPAHSSSWIVLYNGRLFQTSPEARSGINLMNISTFFSPLTVDLFSPCIDLSNTVFPELRFWYHRYFYNGPTGNCMIDIHDGETWVNGVDTLIGQNQDSINAPYLERRIDLTAFNKKVLKVRFRYSSATSLNTKQNCAIDDFSIVDLPPNDVQLNATFVNESRIACYLDSIIELDIDLENRGYLPISPNSVTVNVQVNGGAIESEIIPIGLPVRGKTKYKLQFLPKIRRSSLSNIKVWLDMPQDQLSSNNTVEFTYSKFAENFEGETANLGSGRSFKNSWVASSTTGHWDIKKDAHNDANTGPVYDHTQGAGFNGKYLLLNPPAGSYSEEITTTCINLGSALSPKMSFWYHKFGSQMGDLYIDVYNGSNWFLAIDSVIGQTHLVKNAPWIKKTVDLSNPNFIGNNIQVRFRAVGSGSLGYMGIDDISFETKNPYDLSLSQIESPSRSSCYSSSNDVKLVIKNNGILPIDFTQDTGLIEVNVIGISNQSLKDTLNDNSLNGGSPLMAGDSIFLTVGQINLQSLGRYIIIAEVDLLYDDNVSNNLNSKTIDVLSPRSGVVSLTGVDTSTQVVCINDTINLTSNNAFGDLQWQTLIGSTWQDIIGANDTLLQVIAQKDAQYRVVACSTAISAAYSLNPDLSLFDFSITGDSLNISCGSIPQFTVYDSNSEFRDYEWYTSLQASSPFYSGDTLSYIGTLVSTTNAFNDTVYLQAANGYQEGTVGPLDPNVLGSNSFATINTRLNFNIQQTNVINSVDIYPQTTGDVRVNITNPSGSQVFFDSTYQLIGFIKNTIDLNVKLSPGNYSIGFDGATMQNVGGLRRNIGVTGPSTYSNPGGTFTITTPTTAYYYFYNWSLGDECISERTPVYLYADCLVGLENESRLNENIQIFPNPTENTLNISLGQGRELVDVQVIDISGSIVKQVSFKNKKEINLDIEGAKGIYFIRLLLDNQDVIMKKVIKQ